MSTTTPPADVPSNQTNLIIVLVVVKTFTVIVVGLRIFGKTCILKKSMGKGDWCMLFAMITGIALAVGKGISIRYGTGKHIYDLPVQDPVPALKIIYANQVIYPMALGLTKAAILLYYYEIFIHYPVTKRVVDVCLAFTIAMSVAFTFAFAFQCTPVSHFYDSKASPTGTCMNKVALNYTAAAFNIATDIWTFGIPIPTFWSLNCSMKKKIILIMLFSLGLLTCVTSVLRLKTLYDLATTTDNTWVEYYVTLWTSLETALGVITGSIPSLGPVVDKYFPKFWNTSNKSSKVEEPLAPSWEIKGGPSSKSNSLGNEDSMATIDEYLASDKETNSHGV